MWQEVIVTIVVALAAIGLIRSLVKKGNHKGEDCSCSSTNDACAGCPIKTSCKKPIEKR